MLLKSFCLSKVHKKDSKVFGLIISLLLLMHTTEGQSEETDLSHTIKAMTCDDVVLPCHVSPPGDHSLASVEWGRPDLMPRFVYVWYNQKEYLSDQNTAYRGRTSLFHDKLKDGDVSLKLSNVRHSDNGKYRCYSPRDETEYFVKLLVGSVSPPGFSLGGLDKSSGGVMLDCSSAGWFPEPEIFWLDGEGSIMSAGAAEKTRSPDGLYTVSSRVTVEKRHNNNITCRVQQKDINQTRETHFYVPDDFFMAQSGCSVHVTFIVIFVIMLIFGFFLFIWIKKQNKNKMKKLEEKVNEEQQQLMKEEKQNLAEKKSNQQLMNLAGKKLNLEEEIKKRNEDQRSIDQEIEVLMKMSEELKEQKKHLTDQREEAEKMAEENDKKLKAVVEEVEKQKEYKTEKKAQGYLKLKQIMTESNETLEKRKKSHQKMELMTEKLMSRTSDEVTKLKERKQELEKHVEELQKQLKEVETQM
ncbi:butyrophilin subfamily 2 member A2-like [Fundulus heteroclitus]|uniref:butyrophilin subfamily 2 member A2-like n=1 Tax=Fundulus heteroclitus TaxID=8078 RepID=UPI00165C4B15|nr:butyrophilin subfamily 2 member A2-like [Fundulus heteroclitus]